LLPSYLSMSKEQEELVERKLRWRRHHHDDQQQEQCTHTHTWCTV
jgi:hypothetical protein